MCRSHELYGSGLQAPAKSRRLRESDKKNAAVWQTPLLQFKRGVAKISLKLKMVLSNKA